MTEQENIYHKNLINSDFDIPVFLPLEEGIESLVDLLNSRYDN